MKLAQREERPAAVERESAERQPTDQATTAGHGPPAILEGVPPDQPPPVRSDGGDDADELKVVLDVMKGLADQEFDRGERLSNKARQAFAFVAVLFAGVQALVLTTLADYFVSDGQRWAVLVMAGAAVVVTAATGILAIKADALKSFANLSSDDVLESANASLGKGAPVAADFIELYATALDERRAAVKKRRGWLTATQIVAAATIAILAVEILYALYVRLPS